MPCTYMHACALDGRSAQFRAAVRLGDRAAGSVRGRRRTVARLRYACFLRVFGRLCGWSGDAKRLIWETFPDRGEDWGGLVIPGVVGSNPIVHPKLFLPSALASSRLSAVAPVPEHQPAPSTRPTCAAGHANRWARMHSRRWSPSDGASFSPSEGRPRMCASDVRHLLLRNRLARCRGGQTFCDRLPAPSLRPCEIHVQMRPRPYSRAIGRSASAKCPLLLGARALAQCERPDNTRSGSCPLHSRTAAAGCAVPARQRSQWPQGRRLVRPSCAPTLEPSIRLCLRVSEEGQSR